MKPALIFRQHTGFTLVEISIVLAIFALLMGGTLVLLTSQRDIVHIRDTEKRLSDVQEALMGFAMAYGRLPCPATENGLRGEESPVGGGACEKYAGFVPGVTLGIAPVNEQGYVIDAWGNPLRYAVTNANSAMFTTAGKLREQWKNDAFYAVKPAGYLVVCNSSAMISGTACGGNAKLTEDAIAVLVSTGKNGGLSSPDQLALRPDEQVNLNGESKVFVSHAPSPADAPQGEFDDRVTWLSPPIFFNRLITAGRL